MHRQDVECFGIKYRKGKSSGRKMGKYKAKEIKDLSDFIKEKRKKYRIQTLQEAKSVIEKIMKVGEFIMGPKHKPAERTAIYDPKSDDLLTDKKEISYMRH